MKHMVLALAGLVCSALTMAAELQIEIKDGWVRLPPPGAPAAAYFTVHNHGEATILRDVHSPLAGMSMIHGTEHENGMAKMRHVDSLPVGRGGVIQLAPGGLHVMLMRLKQPLQEGQQVPLVLQFDGGEKHISLPVQNR